MKILKGKINQNHRWIRQHAEVVVRMMERGTMLEFPHWANGDPNQMRGKLNNYKGAFSNRTYNASYLNSANPSKVPRNLKRATHLKSTGWNSHLWPVLSLCISPTQTAESRLSEPRAISKLQHTHFSDQAKRVITQITAVSPEPSSWTLAQQPRKV